MLEAQIQVEWAADAATLADAIGDQRLFRIYATWLGMPDYPRLPALASIDRADLIRMWPNLVLVDVLPDGRLRYRSARSIVRNGTAARGSMPARRA